MMEIKSVAYYKKFFCHMILKKRENASQSNLYYFILAPRVYFLTVVAFFHISILFS